MTLNEPIAVECAQALALRTLRDAGPSDDDRLTYAFRRCLSRPPTADERAELLALLTKETQRLGQPGSNPLELATADPANPPKLPDGTTPAQLAAYTLVARVLLNLDETITKE
jgi:hypothetical protein